MVCKCGLLTQKAVDEYKRLFDFYPQPIQGVEKIDDKQHPPTILGLVESLSYKHWMLNETLNVLVMLDLKWRDPTTSRWNKPKQEITALVEEAKTIYAHFKEPPPPMTAFFADQWSIVSVSSLQPKSTWQ